MICYIYALDTQILTMNMPCGSFDFQSTPSLPILLPSQDQSFESEYCPCWWHILFWVVKANKTHKCKAVKICKKYSDWVEKNSSMSERGLIFETEANEEIKDTQHTSQWKLYNQSCIRRTPCVMSWKCSLNAHKKIQLFLLVTKGLKFIKRISRLSFFMWRKEFLSQMSLKRKTSQNITILSFKNISLNLSSHEADSEASNNASTTSVLFICQQKIK